MPFSLESGSARCQRDLYSGWSFQPSARRWPCCTALAVCSWRVPYSRWVSRWRLQPVAPPPQTNGLLSAGAALGGAVWILVLLVLSSTVSRLRWLGGFDAELVLSFR